MTASETLRVDAEAKSEVKLFVNHWPVLVNKVAHLYDAMKT